MAASSAPSSPTEPAGEVLVLCYHALSEEWPAQVAVSPAALESQLRRLLAAGYEATTFSDAVSRPRAAKALAVTFDDAYLSVFEQAFPILRALGIPATMFVPTAYQGEGALRSWAGLDRWQSGRWQEELRGVSWSQLGELAAAGWEIGSHTRSHRRLPELGDAELAGELEGSRADCEEHLGLPCRLIAYPYGKADERVVRAARAAGYTAGATVSEWRQEREQKPDPMCWPRLGIRRADNRLRLRAKLTLHRHPRAWNLARRLRPRDGGDRAAGSD